MTINLKLPRKFTNVDDKTISEVHGIVKPIEVYRGSNFFAEVYYDPQSSRHIKLLVYRISPIGVELEIQNESEEIARHLYVGSVVNLTVLLGTHISKFIGLTVSTNHSEGEKKLIGVRWIQSNKSGSYDNANQSKQWICGVDFLPVGIAPNPVQFNDFIYFNIRQIFKDGVVFTTSLRNKLLIKDIILSATVSFPAVGQIYLNLQVKEADIAHESGKEVLRVHARILDLDKTASEVIGQYLLQFNSRTTIKTLQEEGFKVTSAFGAFVYSYVKKEQDYIDVLNLRKYAYAGVGKMDQNLPFEKTGDIFDSRARILTVRHYGKLVGSMRIMFHSGNDETEHEQFVKFPENFPKKYEMAEVTRICTDPEYRGSDLFYSIIQQMVLVPAQAKRQWILGSATRKLLPVYLKIGFCETPITYSHADLGNEEHVIMLLNVPKVICGQGIGVVTWNRLYSNLLIYLKDNYNFVVTPLDRVRISIYQLIGLFLNLPIIKYFFNKK